jgi:hypothetical protein
MGARFPVRQGEAPLGRRRLQAASKNPEQISAWWREFPHALIGVPTGAASGIFAVDLDGVAHGGPDGLVAWDKLTAGRAASPTLRHETPNGGIHLVYRYDPQRPVTNRRGALPEGVDVRGDGGYTIWPPSKLPDGRSWRVPENCETDAISDAPEWLYELLAETPATPPSSGKSNGAGAYADAALADELAAVSSARRGQRNATLNKAAFSLGQFVAAQALSAPDVEARLYGAAQASGLAADDGERSVRATIRSGLEAGQRQPRDIPAPNHNRPAPRRYRPGGPAPGPEALGFIWHGDGDDELIAEDQLVDEALPRVGVALMSGQWGKHKTFAAFDLAGSLMTMTSFAGHPVLKQGGTLWLAAEGQGQVRVRLEAIGREKIAKAGAVDGAKEIDPKRMPFVWRMSCPRLSGDGARAELERLIAAAAKEMRLKFDLPLALVVIDALTSAALFKDADDTSESARAFAMLASLAAEFGLLILVIDHFGKNPETGTRNASTKEDFADAVLALLGEKGMTGEIKNPRMALRKVRGGKQGELIAIEPRRVAVGQRTDGKEITTLVIDWRKESGAGNLMEAVLSPRKAHIPKSVAFFRRALIEALDACGKDMSPRAGMPQVKAVDREIVRAEFLKAYPAKNRKAKEMAFLRCEIDAVARSIAGHRAIGAEGSENAVYWLLK